MRRLGSVAGLIGMILVTAAHADTVYLKNGDIVWGSEVVEVDGVVSVTRPGDKLRFPKADVLRIERARLSIPRYYNAPDGGGFTSSAPIGPPGMAAPGTMPGAQPTPPAPGTPGGPPAFGTPGPSMPQPAAMQPAMAAPGPSATPASGPVSPALQSGAPASIGPTQAMSVHSAGAAPSASVPTAPVMGPAPPPHVYQSKTPPGQALSPRDRDVPPPPR